MLSEQGDQFCQTIISIFDGGSPGKRIIAPVGAIYALRAGGSPYAVARECALLKIMSSQTTFKNDYRPVPMDLLVPLSIRSVELYRLRE